MNMDTLLRKLVDYGPKAFDAETVAHLLGIPKKHASNDLRRLWQRGYLKRIRVKRKCKTSSGIECYRGYKYLYTLSSKGLNRVEWAERKFLRDIIEMREVEFLQKAAQYLQLIIYLSDNIDVKRVAQIALDRILRVLCFQKMKLAGKVKNKKLRDTIMYKILVDIFSLNLI